MEATFYEDHHENDVNILKHSMTLDLNCARQQAKRTKFNSFMTNNSVPSSPDLHIFQLGSPELERLIISHQNGVVTTMPTPSAFNLPQTAVTELQEQYALGFVEVLNELHHSDSSQGDSQHVGIEFPVSNNSADITYTNLEYMHVPTNSHAYSIGNSYSMDGSIVFKEEPQTVPSIGSSPPMSPIDMDNQEKIKLERKRERNRLAASKCRRRKLERISQLEDKLKSLQTENTELSAVIMRLKKQVGHLQKQVMEHKNSGCQIPDMHTY